MNRKKLVFLAAFALLLTGCGKTGGDDAASKGTEKPKIVANHEAFTATDESIPEDEVTSSEEYITDDFQPTPETLNYETGVELASVRTDKGTIPIKSGDNLRDVIVSTGLKYISWNQFHTEGDFFSFYGKGYALNDVKKGEDLPKDYDPSYIFLQTVNEKQVKMGDLEADKNPYSVCALKMSANDINDGDFVVGFINGVTIGMSKEEIDKLLTEDKIYINNYGNTSLYDIENKLVLYVEFDADNKAETIYAMPNSLVNVKKFNELANPPEPEKPEEDEKKEGEEEKSEDNGDDGESTEEPKPEENKE